MFSRRSRLFSLHHRARSARARAATVVVIGAAAATAVILTARAGSATVAAQAAATAPQPTLRLIPDDLQDTSWLAKLADAQVKAVAGLPTFHDFQFTDRRVESGITFRHRIVDDAGKTYKAAHYDHGNGVAIADVDGDGLPRHLLRQPGRRQPALEERAAAASFENITAAAGVAVPARSASSASFADIDNDGDADLYVTTVRGGNVLFENDGQRPLPRHLRGLRPELHRALVGRGVLRLRPRRPARPVPRQRRALHDRHDRGGDGYKYYVAFDDAFSGHLKPERAEPSILYRNEGGNRFVDVSQAHGPASTSRGPATPA